MVVIRKISVGLSATSITSIHFPAVTFITIPALNTNSKHLVAVILSEKIGGIDVYIKTTFANKFYINHERNKRTGTKRKQDSSEDFQLIDVREDFEYEMSNLGGLLIPLGGVLIEAGKIDKTKPGSGNVPQRKTQCSRHNAAGAKRLYQFIQP